MWDGLKQIIYEFRQPKEVREKTRKYIKSKGKKMIDEANEDSSSYVCAGARVFAVRVIQLLQMEM